MRPGWELSQSSARSRPLMPSGFAKARACAEILPRGSKGFAPRYLRSSGSEQTRAEVMKNFQARVRELLANLPVNEKRLYEEASSASQHGDISEEITRLKIHLDGLGDLLNREGPVGKSIEFLLQEINREVNTMGSKSQNAALSHLTVEVKAEAEKMREQVQNVE